MLDLCSSGNYLVGFSLGEIFLIDFVNSDFLLSPKIIVSDFAEQGQKTDGHATPWIGMWFQSHFCQILQCFKG